MGVYCKPSVSNSGDVDRWLFPTQAILSMGTNSGATTMQQADFLRALQAGNSLVVSNINWFFWISNEDRF
jgi:hypothetical protein